MGFADIITSIISDRLEGAAKNALAPVAPYLRRITIGALLIILSAVVFALTLLFISAGMFLSLSGYDTLSEAAFWTALPGAVVGGLLIFWGIYIIRPPRP